MFGELTESHLERPMNSVQLVFFQAYSDPHLVSTQRHPRLPTEGPWTVRPHDAFCFEALRRGRRGVRHLARGRGRGGVALTVNEHHTLWLRVWLTVEEPAGVHLNLTTLEAESQTHGESSTRRGES